MTPTMMPANKSPIQIQICGPLAPSGLALLRAARASPSPYERVAVSKDGQRQNGRYSGTRWMIGKQMNKDALATKPMPASAQSIFHCCRRIATRAPPASVAPEKDHVIIDTLGEQQADKTG